MTESKHLMKTWKNIIILDGKTTKIENIIATKYDDGK